MEVKKFCEYSEEEKKELLNHLWHYYGKHIYTLEDLINYNRFVKSNSDQLFDLAVTTYFSGLNFQTTVLTAMRNNKLHELFNRMPIFEKGSLEERKHEVIALKLLSEVVSTYNRPEPSVPMSEEQIKEQVTRLVKTNKKGFH